MLLRVYVTATRLGFKEPLADLLSDADTEVTILPEGADLIESLEDSACDVLVVDRDCLGDDPAELLATLSSLPDVHDLVVLHGSEATPEERAALASAGATATIQRDLNRGPLEDTLGQLLTRRRSAALRALRANDVGGSMVLEDFATESPAMKRLLDVARRVAVTDATLLISGETGVGKEFLVQGMHRASRRSEGPFVAVNCSALSSSLVESELFGHVKGAFTGAIRDRRGCFELAHSGTIFLDEVGDLPHDVQVKLLRVLQEREVTPVGSEKTLSVDVRVMAATNRDLEAEIAAKRFRPDLYYRLGVIRLEVPPLRDRREDLPRLIESHMHRAASLLGRYLAGVDREALAALMAYRWPGNVRELANVIERAVILSEGTQLRLCDLPDEFARPSTTPVDPDAKDGGPAEIDGDAREDELLGRPWRSARETLLEHFDRRYFGNLLAMTHGRLSDVAERADVSPRTLYDHLQRLGFHKEDFKLKR